MNKLRLPVVFAGLLFLGGCSLLQPRVDSLEPMVPATQQPAQDNNPLVDNMDEPQPVDQGITDTSLWQRMRDGFGLDESLNNSRIDAQRAWFVDHQAYLDRVATRAKRYLYYITQQTEKRDMPLELTLLPVVESGFDPFAYSRSKASGPWQFMPATGAYFDLTQDWWYDGRRDLVASTNAALTYLQRLADRFDGNWLLALASYNSGAGTVSRAIKRNQRKGLPTDFWHLDLPRETRAYVPKLLAVAQLVANPQQYGITLPDIPNQPYFDIIDTGGQLDLSEAANMADISVQELYMLNPGFNRWATPPNGPNRLLIPISHSQRFKAALAALPDAQRVTWKRYEIRAGDSLLSISQRKNIPVATLRHINHIKGNVIIAGNTLLIPGGHGGGNDYTQALTKNLLKHNQPTGRRSTQYRVRSGDSLWTIAQRFNVPMSKLMAWNRLSRRSTLHPGQSLKLYGVASPKANYYKVRSGDSLWTIANQHQVSVANLVAWNHISKTKPLQPGQKLKLLGAATPAKVPVTGRYKVQAGDSLWSIAHAHQLSVQQLLAWNNLSKKSTLRPGQQLKLAAKSAPKPRSYKVQSGDSLWSIAKDHKISVEQLLAWNDINKAAPLQPGQQITFYTIAQDNR